LDVVDLLDFSNIGPSELVGMLMQVGDLLGSIAGSPLLATPIPFTDLTLGDILDIGGSFKESVLDPLFVSGDILRPDNNGDGSIDAQDLQFSSLQDLLDRLERALDLPDTVQLTADYFVGAQVAIKEATAGDKTKQRVEVRNTKSGDYTLSFLGTNTAKINFGDDADTVKTKIEAALPTGTTLASVTVETLKKDGDDKPISKRYEVTFADEPTALLLVDSSNLTKSDIETRELRFGIVYSQSFGFGEAKVGTAQQGGGGLNETQSVTINAVKSDGALGDVFTLAFRPDANAASLITGDIAFNAKKGDVESTLEALGISISKDSNTVQTLLVRNTDGGQYTLKIGAAGTESAQIAFAADAQTIEEALDALSPGVQVVDRSFEVSAGHKFLITFSGDTEELAASSQYADGDLFVALDVTVDQEESDDPYEIEFIGALMDTNIPTLVSDSSELLAALDINFGTSLGDLASLTTTGSFSPLATIETGIAFGIDLNPGQALDIAPVAWAPGPRIDVATTINGDGGSTAEEQTVTLSNASGGNFTLTLGNKTTDVIAWNAPANGTGPPESVEKRLVDAGITATVAETTSAADTTAGKTTSTITFAATAGNVAELRATSLLTGAAEDGQIVGTNDATFQIEIFNRGFQFASDGVVSDVTEQSLGTFDITVSKDTTNGSFSDLGDDVRREINEQLKAFALGFFDTVTGQLRTGALDAGDGSAAGDSVTADVAPLAEKKNDVEFTLELTQLMKSGTWSTVVGDLDSKNELTVDGDGEFSAVKVGDVVWRIVGGDVVGKATVESIEENGNVKISDLDSLIKIDENRDGTIDENDVADWRDADDYEIRRVTEVDGRLRAVDVLDRVDPNDPTGVQIENRFGNDDPSPVWILTLPDDATGNFLVAIDSTLTREISAQAEIARPDARVPPGTTASQQLILERAEGGTFDLDLQVLDDDGNPTTASAVDIPYNISEDMLETRLEM
ncbi:MAG: hypothetical protein DRR15_18690, partial [Gammaproteobacteria bacterium]